MSPRTVGYGIYVTGVVVALLSYPWLKANLSQTMLVGLVFVYLLKLRFLAHYVARKFAVSKSAAPPEPVSTAGGSGSMRADDVTPPVDKGDAPEGR